MIGATLLLQILVLIIILVGGLILRNFLPKYFEEKARNLATREDIEEITRRIETVKSEVSRMQSVDQAKYSLRHAACIEALALIDAYYSHILSVPDSLPPVRQSATTAEARACHNRLILSCGNPRVLDLFATIMFGPSDASALRPPTDLLNDFRNMVRDELGFGEALPLDREKAWFGRFSADPSIQVQQVPNEERLA